ncbi:uncharacterized protein [Haliotis cracherodii]|uniref:uncharacterized protein n=1 Tax=Haliotis cracherodii TaxID=6455 RepID=UPI0039E84AE2
MSDLPASRVQPSSPFTSTGLDCFGPHTVKEGRKNVKRLSHGRCVGIVGLIRSVWNVLNPLQQEFGERLDDDLYRTLLCEVEAILNSRPLTTVSSDPKDVHPISPNHLLMVKASAYIPPPGVFQPSDDYACRRLRRVQHLAEVFWSRWKKEYLCSLQHRQIWHTQHRNFQYSEVVLFKDDIFHRSAWSMARVSRSEPDGAGKVRSVVLKTKDSELRRPIHKLVLLVPADAEYLVVISVCPQSHHRLSVPTASSSAYCAHILIIISLCPHPHHRLSVPTASSSPHCSHSLIISSVCPQPHHQFGPKPCHHLNVPTALSSSHCAHSLFIILPCPKSCHHLTCPLTCHHLTMPYAMPSSQHAH